MTKEEAKDYIREWCPYDRQEDVIKTLDQEPKMGHWIGGDGHYICSCCRCDPEYFLEPLGLDGGSYMAIPMKYCPNCGAEMTEED